MNLCNIFLGIFIKVQGILFDKLIVFQHELRQKIIITKPPSNFFTITISFNIKAGKYDRF